VNVLHVEGHRPSMRLIPLLESDCEPSKVQYIEVLSRFLLAQPWWDPGSRKARYRSYGLVGRERHRRGGCGGVAAEGASGERQRRGMVREVGKSLGSGGSPEESNEEV